MNKDHCGLHSLPLQSVIWSKKFKFHDRLKSAILAIFQKAADWLDCPGTVGAALHIRS